MTELTGIKIHLAVMTVAMTLLAMVTVGTLTILFGQISRLDGKIDTINTRIDAIGPRISEEAARTRQELIGIANAISNSIIATRQMQQPLPKEPQ